MRTFIILVVAGFFFGFPVWGATFAGSLKSSTDSYNSELGPPTDSLIPYVQIDLNSKHKFSKRLRMQWRIFALSNLEAESKGSTEEMPFNEQVFVDIPEGFVERKWGSSKFRVGMNTINWGVVDGYSPSNVVNTSAYFHPQRTPKRGAPMVELQSGSEAFSAHFVYIPIQPRAILPATDSRWLPRDMMVNLTSALATVKLPERMDYTYGSEVELGTDDHGFGKSIKLGGARQNNIGARLSSHLGAWDLQLTYFDGASPFPKIRPTVVVNSTSDGFVAITPWRLDPISYRIRNTGLGITHAGEKWIYRMESAYTNTLSDGYGLQPWSWASVAGIETNIELGTNVLTVIAQYYHTETPAKADNYISSSYRLFDHTGVLGLRLPVNNIWLLNMSALYETETQSLFWTAGFEQKIKDVLKWGLAWRDFSAQEPGLIKTFDKNDHINLDMTYYF